VITATRTAIIPSIHSAIGVGASIPTIVLQGPSISTIVLDRVSISTVILQGASIPTVTPQGTYITTAARASQSMIIAPMTTTPMIVQIAMIDARRIPRTTTPDMGAVIMPPIGRNFSMPGGIITMMRPPVIMIF
jgi:hypothetical protein